MRVAFHIDPRDLQHHVDNHKGLTARCNDLTPRERDSIQNCAELREFLPRAINFLQEPHGHIYSQEVAHYLMGKIDHLPEGLEPPCREMPRPIKTLLHDLLRVHRHQWLGKSEAWEKTINKLQFLNNQLFDYDARLAAWEDSAPPGEQEARRIAVHSIYSAMYAGRGYLQLSQLDLTSIPPLPQDLINNLKRLDLGENRLTSLAGLPDQMKNLESLTLRDNQLISLVGMPSHLNKLKQLRLNRNELV